MSKAESVDLHGENCLESVHLPPPHGGGKSEVR